MAPAVKPPKPGKTGTPKGMEGVRPGSPQAIKAGYKPPSPPKASGKPGGAPFAVSFNANGTTTLKPPTAASVAAPPPPPTAAPVTPFNYANAFLADYRYAPGLASITRSQLGIEQKYGVRLRRAPNGLPMYRLAGSPQGSGNVTTTIDPVTGTTRYVNAAGVEVAPATLELDYEVLKPGDPGYSEGAFGSQTMASANRQLGLGDTAAQAGARRSGMRASSQLQEVAALQAAIRGLTTGVAGEFEGTTDRYAALLNQIYPDLVKRAGDYSATPPAAETPAAPSAPSYAGAPTDQTTYAGYALPPARSPLSAGPAGEFMRMITSITEAGGAGGGTYGWKDQITSLEKMKTTYSLTPQQIKYVDDKIAAIRKANTKTSNTTTPAPSAPAPAPSRPAPAPAPTSVPKPSGAGAMYERRGPWQYLGKARGWVKVG